MQYDHRAIEKKWQEQWEKMGAHTAIDGETRPKFFGLIEFPYPSGDGLHTGHIRSNTAMDIICRKRRMQGYNVLYPIGWDAFGLPTENYAIKTGIHPTVVTKQNTDTFRRQLKALGFSFDWSREINTTDAAYYKWTQWIFLQFYKHGLAYKAKMPINWCLSCKIGLANEEVVGGMCERCGGPTEKREKEQWMLAITKYADRLLADLDTVNYLDRIKIQQQNWIGRSEGVHWQQKIKGSDVAFSAYDSVPQTYMAQTFAVIAPEHALVPTLVHGTEQEREVMAFVDAFKKRKQAGQFDIDKDVEGIFTGRFVENPFGTGDLPLWVATFVVADYGSGIVNCSAHDERDFVFAKKYGIPLRPVMFPSDPVEAARVRNLEYCYAKDPNAIIEQPEIFKGRHWGEVREDLITYVEQQGIGKRGVQYKLRDWVFSRQRYWGEPIPLVFCAACEQKGGSGWIPVPDEQLPVELPQVERYQPTDTGESPLAAMTDWVNTTCPQCGEPARRETDTMPNWAGSSWYFLRYIDPRNDTAMIDPEKAKYWMSVDWYNGGMEHTTLHLLYSRFWNKFLFDIGAVPTSEPYAKRTSHGMILAAGGVKMSKSKGNVINPDSTVALHGADTLRLYEMFMGPFDQAVAWSEEGIQGPKRFLEKVWRIFENQKSNIKNKNVERLLHQTIKKVSDDIESMSFNTAVSQLMICMNAMAAEDGGTVEQRSVFTQLLAPFAPHIAEELWGRLGHTESIFKAPWPTYDAALAKADRVEMVLQVNGKIRDRIDIDAGISEETMKEKARASEKVQHWIVGKTIVKEIVVPGKLINIVVQ